MDRALAAPAACGNGVVEAGESCDGTPRCDPSCLAQVAGERCGDRTVTAPEECDDGNDSDADGCSSLCLVIACGNGRVDPGESCDRSDPTCSTACQTQPPSAPAQCGNGTVEGLEECDDGGTLPDDGCGATCLTEACGNLRLDGSEACDPADGVFCSDACQRISCGDGRKEGGESCDDGNRVAGDGCGPACDSERCGNGRLEPHEDCEPPGTFTCDASCRAVRVQCGDGVRHTSEECDDGNLAFGDGCSPTCRREACGNGRLEFPSEDCEPPGSATCTSRCRRPLCGDGELTRAREECEDGNAESGDGCSASCRVEICGNGVLDAGEQCEPPGTSTCDTRCRSIAVPAPELELPLGGALFQLQNGGFDGTLAQWSLMQSAVSSVRFNTLDAIGEPSSGSVELSAIGAVSAASPIARVAQCVRSAEGATYRLTAAASAAPGQAPGRVQLRVSFFEGPSCGGRSLDGVLGNYGVAPGWSELRLPPDSPVPNQTSTFAAPHRTGSISVALELEPEATGGVLLDRVELVRGAAALCGDGVAEGDEQCEPSVTSGCSSACELPRICGDGIAAPGECEDSDCPADCGAAVAVCGDEETTPPEECDPPEEGSCSKQCTLSRSVCGNGRRESGEECDPPNGWTCSAACELMRCGNGFVEPPEECEPSRDLDCSDTCRSVESLPAICGDGLLQGGEECDPPNPNTWCSSGCLRRNPHEACGDGRVDLDLNEQCDPPGHSTNCGSDCRLPVCGDGKVSGSEQCEPSGTAGDRCGEQCRYTDLAARQCHDCLAETCSSAGAEPDLFAACFDLQGVASSGTAVGRSLRDLCIDAVECMRQSACDIESRGGRPNPLACYCGKSVLAGGFDQSDMAARLRDCRDGVTPARGACREEFERASEAALNPGTGRPFPASVLAAATGSTSEKPALSRAIRLMTECGHASGECAAACSVTPRCGDGVVGIGEACDPQDPETQQRCDPTFCSILPCGNGIIDDGETCDVADPYTSGRCNTACQLQAECGDGRFSASVEACDGSAPGQSWANCCRWSVLGPPANPSHVDGCDRDDNGRIDEAEACRFPEICGNGVQEGTEQCDDGGGPPVPPAVDRCDDQCQRIETDACSVCSKEFCREPQRRNCFDNPQPSVVAACGAVFDCIQTSRCVNEMGQIEPCLCGSLENPFDCATAPTRDGACSTIMTQHSGCDASDTGCVWENLLNPDFPLGIATQLIQCQVDFCFDQCAGTTP